MAGQQVIEFFDASDDSVPPPRWPDPATYLPMSEVEGPVLGEVEDPELRALLESQTEDDQDETTRRDHLLAGRNLDGTSVVGVVWVETEVFGRFWSEKNRKALLDGIDEVRGARYWLNTVAKKNGQKAAFVGVIASLAPISVAETHIPDGNSSGWEVQLFLFDVSREVGGLVKLAQTFAEQAGADRAVVLLAMARKGRSYAIIPQGTWYTKYGPVAVIFLPAGRVTITHEILHTYGACDEYYDVKSPCSCNCRGEWTNLNCATCDQCVERVPCIMGGPAHTAECSDKSHALSLAYDSKELCRSSRGAIGWENLDEPPIVGCEEGTQGACDNYPNQGLCHPGTKTCIEGKWSQCEGGVGPIPEDRTRCDNHDDENCDGIERLCDHEARLYAIRVNNREVFKTEPDWSRHYWTEPEQAIAVRPGQELEVLFGFENTGERDWNNQPGFSYVELRSWSHDIGEVPSLLGIKDCLDEGSLVGQDDWACTRVTTQDQVNVGPKMGEQPGQIAWFSFKARVPRDQRRPNENIPIYFRLWHQWGGRRLDNPRTNDSFQRADALVDEAAETSDQWSNWPHFTINIQEDVEQDCDLLLLGQPCTFDQGICLGREGVTECRGQDDIRCSTEPGGSNSQAREEQCDGLDNDCDGETDEIECGACEPGTVQEEPCGNCGNRTRRCQNDRNWTDFGPCQNQGPCSPRVVEACGNNGTRECQDNCSFGPCVQQDPCNGQPLNACGGCGPVPEEICDGQDNDCDGVVDECPEERSCIGGLCAREPLVGELCRDDGVCRVDPCVDFGLGRHYCTAYCDSDDECNRYFRNTCCIPLQGGRSACVPDLMVDEFCQVGPCGGEPPNACGGCGPAPAEVCDFTDNDCDGQTDEGLDCFLPIYRYQWTNNRDDVDFYFTTSQNTPPGCDGGQDGVGNDCFPQGVRFHLYRYPVPNVTVPLYKLKNPITHDHLYTANQAEALNLEAQPDWEWARDLPGGVPGDTRILGYIATNQGNIPPGSTPIRRVYSQPRTAHFWAIHCEEVRIVESGQGYCYQNGAQGDTICGVVGWVWDEPDLDNIGERLDFCGGCTNPARVCP